MGHLVDIVGRWSNYTFQLSTLLQMLGAFFGGVAAHKVVTGGPVIQAPSSES